LEEFLPYLTRDIRTRRRRIMHAGLWLENLKERGCLKDVGISWRIILKSV
jgi:hypothetical protein